jgi:hypothetical protein
MAEFIHTFTSGRMNKDLDERLVPNAEYRDALNLDLANSDDSNVGALQNIKGTLQIRGKQGTGATWTGGFIDALVNPICIGSYRDDIHERIYWFIASDENTETGVKISAIAEYDQTTNTISPVLVDTQNILNFTSDYLITGINIIDKFLFWTDDQTEPKKINIEKFKTGSVDFVTHTKVPLYLPASGDVAAGYSTNLVGQPNFTEADVTVIKKSPLNAPTLDFSASKYGDNVPGTGITPVSTEMPTIATINFTYIPDVENSPNDAAPLSTYGEYLLNIATPGFYAGSSLNLSTLPNYDPVNIWDGHITFTVNTPPQWQAGDLVILKTDFTNEFYERYNYQVSIKITSVVNATITGQIQAISSNIGRFINSAGDVQVFPWEGLLEETAPMFEYVFPRFAYRWKYIDNEYSCYSPFSEVAFEGGEFEYISSDGYNVGMTNRIRRLVINNLIWSDQEIQEIDILYKESDSPAVYVVDTLKRQDYPTPPTSFQVETELIGAVVEANQILRPWDNVPRKAKAQEIVGNRIVYANYLQNYNVPSVNLNLTLTPTNHPAVADATKIRYPYPSVKSIRTYQAGVVFADEYGRETPVFTSKQGSTKVDISNSDKTNKLTISTTGDAPGWATHYKFFIKENSNEYYNLALDKFYDAEDGNVWLSFPSSERNKVDEETYLILKKQHDTDVAVTTLNRYKILSIKNEAPEFISTFSKVVSSAVVTLSQQIEIGYITITFVGPDTTSNPFFGPKFNGNKIVLSVGGSRSEEYEVAVAKILTTGGDNATYEVTLARFMGSDIGFLETIPIGGSIDITIYEDDVQNKPEFEGRFFVKINRDFAFDTNIISSFAAMAPRYGIATEVRVEPARWTWNGADPVFVFSDDGSSARDSGCSNQKFSSRLIGWSGGVGNRVLSGDATVAAKFPGWQPPTRGSNKFGVMALRVEGFGAYINPFFGHIRSNGNRPSGSGASPNGKLSQGALIRFQCNQATGPYAGVKSQVYTVNYALANASARGERRKVGFGGCFDGNDIRNYRYAIYVELDDAISEEWFPFANDWTTLENRKISIEVVELVTDGGNKLLTSTNPAIFETEPKEKVDLDLYHEASDSLPIENYNVPNQELSWFNCYSYGQGVESNRIRDDYNAVTIDKGPKVSTVLDEPYAAERRGSGFIFSQIYNSTSGINRLNQFIQAQPITKDLNPIYGTIQKLHARDTDLVTLCEDKCLKVLANKDALYNADGSTNITSNQAVLGQAIPYNGEFGISKNPESFASYAYRAYFTDKNRGAVIRLSMDGITNISEKGMTSFFEDNLRTSIKAIGSYDDSKDLYNLTLNNLASNWQKRLSSDKNYQLDPDCGDGPTTLVTSTTLSFKENVDGWTSRKDFIKESGLTLNNVYYTFKNGLIWEHGGNSLYNNFYGVQYESSFNVLINEDPQVVKGYSTLNYTGSASRYFEYLYGNKWYSIAEINANQTIPTAISQKTPGWYTSFIRTDLEAGEVKEFQKKEGKYFNYIKGTLIGCDPDGLGIGGPIEVVSNPQDYKLEIIIDPSCSVGSLTPATPDRNINLFFSFLNCTTNYDAVNWSGSSFDEAWCNVNNYWQSQNGDYITNGCAIPKSAKYFSNQGIGIGTPLYEPETNNLYTGIDGNFLYIPNTVSDPIVWYIDPNNTAYQVPNDWYLLKVEEGVITDIAQYNTLACL